MLFLVFKNNVFIYFFNKYFSIYYEIDIVLDIGNIVGNKIDNNRGFYCVFRIIVFGLFFLIVF